MSKEYILALLAAFGSVISSTVAVRRIIKHENEQCDLRMEAYKEGLKHGEDHH